MVECLTQDQWAAGSNLTGVTVLLLRHKASQEGRGEILLENSLRRWRCYLGNLMHTTSYNCSVLYVQKNIDNTLIIQ